ncbi:hypothetical protein BH10PSE12_BH10PSE12_16600 [soil metagenome]
MGISARCTCSTKGSRGIGDVLDRSAKLNEIPRMIPYFQLIGCPCQAGDVEVDTETLKTIQKTLIGFNKRAERASEESLVATFVDSAPLFDLLSTQNNQIIYGRRGTGKTHALKVLAESVEAKGDHQVFLDLRSVGSNGSIYSDSSRTMVERASTLLVDVLDGLLHEFYSIALNVIDTHLHPDEVTRRLDALQMAVSTVKVTGDVTEEVQHKEDSKRNSGISAKLSLGMSAGLDLTGAGGREIGQAMSKKSTRSGREAVYLNFGTIAAAVADLIAILGTNRLWLLIDEWSEIPVDLQPYLADLFRRVILPVNEITVKIAAIEHRSDFAILKDRGEYVGLELGADISADLNLDDFLVFDNSQEKATEFIANLVFRHYQTAPTEHPSMADPDQLTASIFTQRPVFDEFVRAVEGVPRDALNLIAKIATKAFGQQIAMSHVRAGARDWYNQDKAAVIKSNPLLADLLQHIIAEVIGQRRARAFLLSSKIRSAGVEKLFDSRLLHVLKKNVSSNDEPGERYDVYKIDYGCYVDLINTTKAPEGLIQEDDGIFHEVPRDDYRSIRRAILDPATIPLLLRSENESAVEA